jgi:2-iminobutanoate/2-iminopropanoate deaminase
VQVGEFIFTSGQLGIEPASQQLADGVTAQTEQIITNLVTLLRDVGSALDSLIKTTVYLTDLAALPAVNEVWMRRIGLEAPARAVVGVAALPRGALIEVDVIAYTHEA